MANLVMPGRLVTTMAPPCAATTASTMARPSPVLLPAALASRRGEGHRAGHGPLTWLLATRPQRPALRDQPSAEAPRGRRLRSGRGAPGRQPGQQDPAEQAGGHAS